MFLCCSLASFINRSDALCVTSVHPVGIQCVYSLRHLSSFPFLLLYAAYFKYFLLELSNLSTLQMYFIISHTHLVFREIVIHSQKTVQYCITQSFIEGCNFCNFLRSMRKDCTSLKRCDVHYVLHQLCLLSTGINFFLLDEPFVVLFVCQFLLNPSAV